jgi:hypothetical protein
MKVLGGRKAHSKPICATWLADLREDLPMTQTVLLSMGAVLNLIGIVFTVLAINHESEEKDYDTALARFKKLFTPEEPPLPLSGATLRRLEMAGTIETALPGTVIGQTTEDRVRVLEAGLQSVRDAVSAQANDLSSRIDRLTADTKEGIGQIREDLTENERKVAKIDAVALDYQLMAVGAVALGALFQIAALFFS